MPSSKVVKNAHYANIGVSAFALKDMVVEEKKRLEETKVSYEEGIAFGFKDGHEKGVSQGYAKGFEEGEIAGRAVKGEEAAEYHKTVQLLQPLIAGLKQLAESIVAKSEGNILEISLAVARQIVRKEILEDSEIVLKFVTEGLKSLGPVGTALIRIHPDDFELLSKKSQEILQAVEGIQSLKFEPDPTLLQGDAILESKERSVDARPDSQLAIIGRSLLQNNLPNKEKSNERSGH